MIGCSPLVRVRGIPSSPGADRDRGSGTVLVLGLIAVVIVLTGFVAAVGISVIARHQAEAAADLAALAAAGSVSMMDPESLRGTTGWVESGCARALAVAEANGGKLIICQNLNDGSVFVEVAVTVRVLPRLLVTDGALSATARARAGQPPPMTAMPLGLLVLGTEEVSGGFGVGSARFTAGGD